MVEFLKKVYRKLKKVISTNTNGKAEYDFNKSNPLGGNGERVDIDLNKAVHFDALDVYQKNHFKRYEFAREIVGKDDVCADFACGTGYGTVLIARKAKSAVGADLNKEVISKIKERYANDKNVSFLNDNLLQLNYNNHFDNIISFETIEHFDEADIKQLLQIFNKGLKAGGKLIFSTPFMQEESDEAIKMGFHLTFYINEQKIEKWLGEAGFEIIKIQYQNYETHLISDNLMQKDFIICVAKKRNIDA